MNLLELFLSQVRYAAAVFDEKRRLVHLSPKFEIFFDVNTNDVHNLRPERIFAKNPLILEQLEKVYQTRSRFYLREVSIQTASREEICNAELIPLVDVDDGIHGVAVSLFEHRDDSIFIEQKKRHDAMAPLNLIAAGLAHEIKNPLSGIKGAAQLMLAETGKSTPLAAYARIIVDETERVDRLVRDLLNFTKPRHLQMEKMNINKILHQLIVMLQLTTSKKIAWVEDFDPSLPEISGDEDALKQVFLNLIQNARDAVSQQGTVRVGSNIVTDFMLKTGKKKRQIVKVTVCDTGCGMDAQALKDIFTPFYSTKAQGTGLGLAVVNQLVELHGGSVIVKSEKGEGTEFAVFLPV